eukprot:14586-Heterococcus_DN1.PRE.1
MRSSICCSSLWLSCTALSTAALAAELLLMLLECSVPAALSMRAAIRPALMRAAALASAAAGVVPKTAATLSSRTAVKGLRYTSSRKVPFKFCKYTYAVIGVIVVAARHE